MPAPNVPESPNAELEKFERERVRRKLRNQLFGEPPQPLKISRFEVIERLGQGAWGVVYACFDPDLHREVAVKLVAASLDQGQILSEARALARLTHPNVLTVYETGVHEGVPFIVSEFVRGGTLRAWLAEQRTPEELTRVLRAIAVGLHAAHQRGLVHRDVKPENVLIGLDGRPRVADFGLAVTSSDPSPGAAGTPRYMAPEQLRGAMPDPLSDQYAYCVMAYEALFGNLPSEQQPDRTHPFRAWAPLLLRGSANAAESRFPSLGELIAALDQTAPKPRRLARTALLGIAAGSLVVAAVATAYSWGSGKPQQLSSRLEEETEETEEPAPSSKPVAPVPSNSGPDVEYIARIAVEKMNRGQWQECVDYLQKNRRAPFLSALQIDCARKASTAALRSACKQHTASFGDVMDGCTDTDLKAYEHREKGDYAACVRALYPMDWTSQRNLLLSDCASLWSTKEGVLLACRFGHKNKDTPINVQRCPSDEEFGVVLNEPK